ncbi:MAG: hypothetical protein Q9212_001169 [Teloschistes hypoglaucus]
MLVLDYTMFQSFDDLPASYAALTMAQNGRKTFLDLPLETQKHIFAYVGRKDLVNTLTVSQQFFDLACAQLYRNVEFKLTNSDFDDAGSSMKTAEALQTIVSSDYDYGQYIKSFHVTMAEDNTQSAVVMSRFLWDKAGFAVKALNTALLVLLKKATMLESFLWDVPIDLSGAVYQALHKSQGLRELRLRLDVSLSVKLSIHPGPLPSSSSIANTSSASGLSFPGFPQPGANNQFISLPGSRTRMVKKKKPTARNFWTGNRELSAFKHLSSLSLLGISSLDYLDEIAGCLKSSTTSLKSLTLSLSHDMVQKARKVSAAPPPTDDATSDEDDDELLDHLPPDISQVPTPHAPSATSSTPANTEADVRREKLAQEAILSRIFDLEQQSTESKRLERNLTNLKLPKLKSNGTFTKLMQDVRSMVDKLKETGTNGNEESLTREAIKLVHKATADYLANAQSSSSTPSTSPPGEGIDIPDLSTAPNDTVETSIPPSPPSPMVVDEATTASQPDEDQIFTTPPAADTPLQSTLISNELGDESLDVDMIHPDEDPTEVIEDQEILSDAEDEKEVDGASADLPSPRKRVRFEASKKMTGANRSGSVSPEKSDLAKTDSTARRQEQSPEEAMQAWIREKHGYQLEEVKLYWIPMRAPILARALDLAMLRRITLLNTGPQDGFWMILAGFQSRQGSLGLKSIHTDNVTKSFLRFTKSFHGLTELFLHDRVDKTKTDAAASQPKITITEIRQQALRKHFKTLEKLMLKNENDSGWDLDAKTIILLSSKGGNLVELAVSLGVLNFHHLMQNLPSLKHLQALHLLAVRGASSGGLPHLEYLNSTVDNLSHNSSSRVKYVAVDNMLCQLQRRTSQSVRKFKWAKQKRHQMKLVKGKGKGKAVTEKEDAASGADVCIASDASSETDFPDDKELHDIYAMKAKACVIHDMKEAEQMKIFRNEFRTGSL